MRFYVQISKILLEVDKGTSFKKAIYDAVNAESPHFKKTYKIVIEMIKNKKLLDEISEKFYFSEKIFDINLFHVLLYEFFFSGKKLKIGGNIMKIIKSKKEEVQNYLNSKNINIPAYEQQSQPNKIRNNNESSESFPTENSANKNPTEEKLYFRLNRQKVANEKTILKKLRDEYFIKRDELIENLFYLVKNPEKSKNDLTNFFKIRDEANIIIQTKSSALPAFILKKVFDAYKNDKSLNYDFPEEFNIIDTCAAPGNKTLQLAEYFPNTKIFAYEKDLKRFNLLNDNLNKNNFFENVETYNEDFLQSIPNENYFDNVRLILSDPSCSGSGTKNNLMENPELNKCCLELANSEEETKVMDRLEKLSSFQFKILNHCMKFSQAKIISYSTCSVYYQENEYVVEKLLEKNPNYRLINIFKYLVSKNNDNDDNISRSHFHKGISKKTKFTLRACRKCSGGDDGFFVALFEKLN